MRKTIDEYRIFVASPSDVNAERDFVDEVVADINAKVLKYRTPKAEAQSMRWERDATRGYFGGHPQKQILKDLVDTSDAMIVILWSKIGSSGAYSISGTLDELNRAIKHANSDRNFKLWIYFKVEKISIKPSDIDWKSAKYIQSLKQKLSDKASYGQFETEKEFKAMVHNDLMTWIENSDPYDDNFEL